jgi:hypothetical protein
MWKTVKKGAFWPFWSHLWCHWLIDPTNVIHNSTRIDKNHKICLHVNPLKYHQKWESCEKPLKKRHFDPFDVTCGVTDCLTPCMWYIIWRVLTRPRKVFVMSIHLNIIKSEKFVKNHQKEAFWPFWRQLWCHWLIDPKHVSHHSMRINKTFKSYVHVNPLKCYQKWKNWEKLKKPFKIVTFWWRVSRFCNPA